MTSNDEKAVEMILYLFGGCGFGAWQSSIGAGIFMTITLMIFGHLADRKETP